MRSKKTMKRSKRTRWTPVFLTPVGLIGSAKEKGQEWSKTKELCVTGVDNEVTTQIVEPPLYATSRNM